jgi:DNA-binding CsgD family transcriptional regulator
MEKLMLRIADEMVAMDDKQGRYFALGFAARYHRIRREAAREECGERKCRKSLQLFSPQEMPAAAPEAMLNNPMLILTVREREVVELLISGSSNKQIAHALGISAKTVEAHRARAIKRLGIKTSAQLIRMAGEFGLHQVINS